MLKITALALSAVFLLGAVPASAQTSAPSPPPIGSVLKEIPPDLWHFLSWDTAMVLGIGGGAAAVGHICDDDLAGEIDTNVALNDAMAPENATMDGRSACPQWSSPVMWPPRGSTTTAIT